MLDVRGIVMVHLRVVNKQTLVGNNMEYSPGLESLISGARALRNNNCVIFMVSFISGSWLH